MIYDTGAGIGAILGKQSRVLRDDRHRDGRSRHYRPTSPNAAGKQADAGTVEHFTGHLRDDLHRGNREQRGGNAVDKHRTTTQDGGSVRLRQISRTRPLTKVCTRNLNQRRGGNLRRVLEENIQCRAGGDGGNQRSTSSAARAGGSGGCGNRDADSAAGRPGRSGG